MPKSSQLLSFLIIFLLGSCRPESKYTVAIKDFRTPLQPHLTKIVSTGIAKDMDNILQEMATDEELLRLQHSEHPLLRAVSFAEMLERNPLNNSDIIIKHLADTAIIPTYEGEFGIGRKTVSDYLIEACRWKTVSDKEKTIHEVITKHNYLKSAYSILGNLAPQDNYYSHIKEMVTRGPNSTERLDIKYYEYALYGLAKYKKKEDITVIRNVLLSLRAAIGDLSFTLMEEFPDTAYLQVYEDLYPKGFYLYIKILNEPYTAVTYMHSIASYKSERSAKILTDILVNLSSTDCLPGSSLLSQEIKTAIWDNPCEAYAGLRKRIGEPKDYEKSIDTLQSVDQNVRPTDTVGAKIRWLH